MHGLCVHHCFPQLRVHPLRREGRAWLQCVCDRPQGLTGPGPGGDSPRLMGLIETHSDAVRSGGEDE